MTSANLNLNSGLNAPCLDPPCVDAGLHADQRKVRIALNNTMMKFHYILSHTPVLFSELCASVVGILYKGENAVWKNLDAWDIRQLSASPEILLLAFLRLPRRHNGDWLQAWTLEVPLVVVRSTTWYQPKHAVWTHDGLRSGPITDGSIYCWFLHQSHGPPTSWALPSVAQGG